MRKTEFTNSQWGKMNTDKKYIAFSFLNVLLLGGTAFFFVGIGSVCSMTLPGMFGMLGWSLIIGLLVTVVCLMLFKSHRKAVWWLTCSAPLVYALWGNYYYKYSIPFVSNAIEETLMGVGFIFAVFIAPIALIACLAYITMISQELPGKGQDDR